MTCKQIADLVESLRVELDAHIEKYGETRNESWSPLRSWAHQSKLRETMTTQELNRELRVREKLIEDYYAARNAHTEAYTA